MDKGIFKTSKWSISSVFIFRNVKMKIVRSKFPKTIWWHFITSQSIWIELENPYKPEALNDRKDWLTDYLLSDWLTCLTDWFDRLTFHFFLKVRGRNCYRSNLHSVKGNIRTYLLLFAHSAFWNKRNNDLLSFAHSHFSLFCFPLLYQY